MLRVHVYLKNNTGTSFDQKKNVSKVSENDHCQA